MSKFKPEFLIDLNQWLEFFQELSCESDRAAAILSAAWIDHLLEKRLTLLFCKGNRKERTKLFEAGGAFATLASKIDAAFCIGWLDPDVHHDLQVIREIRNEFAHQIHGLSMGGTEFKELRSCMQK